MRNTKQERYTPKLKEKCKGYIEVYIEDDDTDS